MKTEITKDLANKKLHITRIFDAPRNMVWKAWTEPEWLDRWWAPLPYQTKTKSMDFKEGGFWLYYMLSPEGDKHWCRLDYLTIFKNDYIIILPRMHSVMKPESQTQMFLSCIGRIPSLRKRNKQR